MNILILGASGFIGSEIARRLAEDGHSITGLARNVIAVRRKFPFANWIAADLAQMTAASDWTQLVGSNDVIVNCAGALQDGLSDDLAATQQQAMVALYEASGMAGGRMIVQISARTAMAAAELPFLATKRQADEALKSSGLPHVILRPAIVIGRNAHGGTALIRALASFPFVVALTHSDSPVQTVAVEDVAAAVALAVTGEITSGSDVHLAAEQVLSLREIIVLHRQWLGLSQARYIALPPWVARPVSWVADVAGRLGWRSPLRSTAMAVMSEGVTAGTNNAGLPLLGAAQTLARHPSGVQDLWFSRLYLLKPLLIVCLSLFWLLSGAVPLANLAAAASHFLPFMPGPAALTLTLATCALDIALGLAVLVRPWARNAMLGMLLVTFSYLAGGTVLEPALWLDPLGPLVKVLPSIALTLVALATLEER